eukprot:scaffold1762_cov383-Prasinococcus_capsulatus_cf.AAC.7
MRPPAASCQAPAGAFQACPFGESVADGLRDIYQQDKRQHTGPLYSTDASALVFRWQVVSTQPIRQDSHAAQGSEWGVQPVGAGNDAQGLLGQSVQHTTLQRPQRPTPGLRPKKSASPCSFGGAFRGAVHEVDAYVGQAPAASHGGGGPWKWSPASRPARGPSVAAVRPRAPPPPAPSCSAGRKWPRRAARRRQHAATAVGCSPMPPTRVLVSVSLMMMLRLLVAVSAFERGPASAPASMRGRSFDRCRPGLALRSAAGGGGRLRCALRILIAEALYTPASPDRPREGACERAPARRAPREWGRG